MSERARKERARDCSLVKASEKASESMTFFCADCASDWQSLLSFAASLTMIVRFGFRMINKIEAIEFNRVT